MLFVHARSSLVVGLTLASCWLISATLLAQPPVLQGRQDSLSNRPLDRKGIENLIAFTRLLGYVRYFHPSDEAARADWESFTVNNIDSAESARSPQQLASRLDSVFRTVAPTVRVFPSGNRPAVPKELDPSPGQTIVAWRHRGVGLGSLNSRYFSRRVNGGDTIPGAVGELTQTLRAEGYRGKKIRFAAAVRAEVSGAGNQAQLLLRVERKNGQPGFSADTNDRPITESRWNVYEVSGNVADDAESITFGSVLAGEGSIWMDSASFAIAGDSTSQPSSALKNPDFEQTGRDNEIPGWHAPTLPYSSQLSKQNPYIGSMCAFLTSHDTSNIPLPSPNQPFVTYLGGGIWCMVPLGVYSDSLGTLPHLAGLMQPQREAIIASGANRTLRLAGVALAWNVFQHFYPSFDRTDWSSALRRGLVSAATDTDQSMFSRTLLQLTQQLNGGAGIVHRETGSAEFSLPILWDWTDNMLVVAYVDSSDTSGIKRGDVVLSVNGIASGEALARHEQPSWGMTPQRKMSMSLRSLRCGPEGSELTLTVQSKTDHPDSMKLRRTIRDQALREPRPGKIAEVKPGIFYVDAERISGAEFNNAVPDLEKAKGIVIDLRGDTHELKGEPILHLIDSTVSLTRWSLPVIVHPDRQDMVFEPGVWTFEAAKPRLKAKISFIEDSRTSGENLTWLALVRQYSLGEIVGDTLAGINGIENQFSLPGGYRILWRGTPQMIRGDSQFHVSGIKPSVPGQRTLQGIREGRDEYLDRAIAAVSE